MAKFVNVNRGVQDPYYRYKMPRILAKVEGKGNGIKTVIVNMSEVAKALARPATYPTKYFGCELGAQTNFDLKNDRYIVNGEHDANKLQEILDGFIKKFVLCPECDNPETVLTIRRQAIHSKCKACGCASVIDPKHKISTFILKNPPPVEASEEPKDRGGGSPNADDQNGTNTDVQPSAEVLNHEKPGYEDDWAEPLDQEKMNEEIKKLIIDPDLDKSQEERLDMLHQYFLKAKESGSLGDGKSLLNEAERLELKTKAPLLLAEVLLTKDILDELKEHQKLFLRFCSDNKKAQRCLLGGIELFLEKNPDLLPRAPHIVLALYNLDLCSEEVILSWSEKPSSKYVKKKDFSRKILDSCEKVFTWLREAEPESSDSEDDDIAIDFNDRSRVIGTVVEKKPEPAVNGKCADAAPEINGDNDLDIDNI